MRLREVELIPCEWRMWWREVDANTMRTRTAVLVVRLSETMRDDGGHIPRRRCIPAKFHIAVAPIGLRHLYPHLKSFRSRIPREDGMRAFVDGSDDRVWSKFPHSTKKQLLHKLAISITVSHHHNSWPSWRLKTHGRGSALRTLIRVLSDGLEFIPLPLKKLSTI